MYLFNDNQPSQLMTIDCHSVNSNQHGLCSMFHIAKHVHALDTRLNVYLFMSHDHCYRTSLTGIMVGYLKSSSVCSSLKNISRYFTDYNYAKVAIFKPHIISLRSTCRLDLFIPCKITCTYHLVPPIGMLFLPDQGLQTNDWLLSAGLSLLTGVSFPRGVHTTSASEWLFRERRYINLQIRYHTRQADNSLNYCRPTCSSLHVGL